jgi:lysophospholipid acyltransferase
MRYIKYEKEYKNIDWKACNKVALYHFAAGIFNTFILVVFGKKFQTIYCGTEEFMNQSIIYKYFFMLASVHVLRSKYYIGWKISQAAVIFCGLGYDVKTNEKGESVATFDRIENINITKFELEINPLNRIKYWNRTVHLWLKYHVFMRLVNVERKLFMNNKPLASLITFMVSAFWHGFYPGYFVFFLQYYLIDQVSKYLEGKHDLFNKMEKLSIVPKNLCRLFTCFVINYFGLCFSLLSLTGQHYFNKAFYFVPLTSLICGYLFILYLNIHHKKNRGHGHRGQETVSANDQKTKAE